MNISLRFDESCCENEARIRMSNAELSAVLFFPRRCFHKADDVEHGLHKQQTNPRA